MCHWSSFHSLTVVLRSALPVEFLEAFLAFLYAWDAEFYDFSYAYEGIIPIPVQFQEAFEVFGVDLKVEDVEGGHGDGFI